MAPSPDIVVRCNGAARRVPDWILYGGAAAYAVWIFWLGLTGGLGVEPIKELEHRYGMAGFYFVMAGLAVTPLKTWTGVNLVCWRRAIGLIAFFFIMAHLLVWLVLDVQMLSAIGKDILKRPYITIGMAAFVLMIPLAVTSNNLSMRKLGPLRWRKLHKLTYAITILGLLHYLMQVRGFRIEALIYAVIIVGLLITRLQISGTRKP